MTLLQSGVFHAKIDSNGNAELFSYSGNSAEVIVPAEIDGYKVTKLGEKLFMRHEEIESITLPSTLETIGYSAFSVCSGLKKAIALPENIREIGDSTFYAYPLPEITLPPKLQTIAGGAFRYAKLEKIAIPNSVQKIGYGAFEGCKNLRKIAIGSGVREGIRGDCFKGCSALEEICVSPENKCLRDIDGVLFDKEALKLLKYPEQKIAEIYAIPQTVTDICSEAFQYAKVKKVICPDGLKKIERKAFYGAALQHINIPNNIEYIDLTYYDRGHDGIVSCLPDGVTFEVSENNPHYKVIDGKLALKNPPPPPSPPSTDTSEKTSGMFVYRKTAEGKAIIMRFLLSNIPFTGKNLIDVVLGKIKLKPQTLKELVIPETLDGLAVSEIDTKFGFTSFCPKRIHLPKTIEKAFNGGSFICQHIDVAKDNPHISSQNGVLFKNAVAERSGLTLACFPKNRHSEPDETYRIPDGTEEIGQFAFSGTKHLKRVIIPPSVKLIPWHAFNSCDSIEEVLIEDGCEAVIGGGAFWCNKNLSKITIPSSVTKIIDDAIHTFQSRPPTILCVKNSMAEYFAVKNKLEFRES